MSEYWNAEYDAALKDLTIYVKYKHNSFWSYYYLANVYRGLAKANEEEGRIYLENAKQNYLKAIAINRTNLDTYFEMGLLSDDLEDFKGAVGWARKGIHVGDSIRKSNFPELYGNLGWYLYESNELPDALKASKEALKKDENLLYVRFNLGLISLCMGRVEQAKDFYDDAISNLLKGKHYEGETANKANVIDELGLVDLRKLQQKSQGEVSMNAAKMIEYLAGQKNRLK